MRCIGRLCSNKYCQPILGLDKVVGGLCKVRLADATQWNSYGAGTEFNIPGNSYFDIETLETLDYVCHFG